MLQQLWYLPVTQEPESLLIFSINQSMETVKVNKDKKLNYHRKEEPSELLEMIILARKVIQQVLSAEVQVRKT